jgi:hypothetical protein
LEKDSGNLRLLVSLRDEGGGSPWKSFYRGAKLWSVSQGRWPAGRPAHVAKSSLICPQGAVVEIKSKIVEGKEGKRRGRWSAGYIWPPLNSHFHSSPHLAPLMLTPLTESIKSKANSLHLFPKFHLFLFEIFRFYGMQ